MSATASVSTVLQGFRHNSSLWDDGVRRLKKNNVAVWSVYLVFFICLVALLAPWLAPYPFDEQMMDQVLTRPSMKHWLGTDNLGRDLLSRLIYGARMSMAVGIFTAFISLFFGVIYGAVAGWLGGWVDSAMMRFIDILYSIPTLVLLILVKIIIESLDLFSNPELRAMTGILVALSVVGWVTLARVVRGQVL